LALHIREMTNDEALFFISLSHAEKITAQHRRIDYDKSFYVLLIRHSLIRRRVIN
jgi:hypothetical protein